jgi:hypothetical protein
LSREKRSASQAEIRRTLKSSILTPIFLALLIGAVSCTKQEKSMGERITEHSLRSKDLKAASQVKAFSPVNPEKGAEYMHTVIEADLLSLHVCQGSHKIFVNEPLSAKTEGIVDAQGAAECVVELQSALNEVPATHPAYPDMRTELAWWNKKLSELDPADYHRLNS